MIVAIPMAAAVAHALEMPGKLRLGRDDYLTVQAIYYPGFTRAGIAEPVAIVALLLLAFLTPRRHCGVLAAPSERSQPCSPMVGIFWTRTQPVNRVWVKDLDLGRDGSSSAQAAGPTPTRTGRSCATDGSIRTWRAPPAP